MGETETIKQRAIYVYLPSIEQKEKWQKCAEKLGVSLSKFVIEYVENSLRQEEGQDYKSRSELWKENNELKQLVADSARKNRILETIVDRLEQEVRKYRAQPFLRQEFQGVRFYEKELITLLKNQGVATADQIFSCLGIDPSEHDTAEGISKQLENLEAYGLVKSSPRGWRWTG
jgi:hypothetical protein